MMYTFKEHELKFENGVWYMWSHITKLDGSYWDWREADQERCEDYLKRGLIKGAS